MISNQRQLEVTQLQRDRFQVALAALVQEKLSLGAQIASIEGTMADLEAEIAGYDPMPEFTFKAEDRLALEAIEAYVTACVNAGLPAQGREASMACAEFASWQERHPDLVKLPDHKHVPARTEKS